MKNVGNAMLVWMYDIITFSHKNTLFSNMYPYTLEMLYEILGYCGPASLATIYRVNITSHGGGIGAWREQGSWDRDPKQSINQTNP